MKHFLALSLFLFFATACFAQQTYYLGKNGNLVNSAENAWYTRTVTPLDSTSSLYSIKDYYKSGMLKMETTSSKNTLPLSFEGQCIDYYESGVKASEATYVKNLKIGAFQQYYPNGKLYRVLNFPRDGERDSLRKEKVLLIACYDSRGKVLAEKGNGYYKAYDADFKYATEWGKIKDGQKDSTWQGEDKPQKITFTEEYTNGKLVKGTSVKDGKTFDYSAATVFSPPKFIGSEGTFASYASKHIVYPKKARKNGIHGNVTILFTIEEDGILDDIKVLHSLHPSLDAEAIRVAKQSPKWQPGIVKGIPARFIQSRPITFVLQ